MARKAFEIFARKINEKKKFDLNDDDFDENFDDECNEDLFIDSEQESECENNGETEVNIGVDDKRNVLIGCEEERQVEYFTDFEEKTKFDLPSKRAARHDNTNNQSKSKNQTKSKSQSKTSVRKVKIDSFDANVKHESWGGLTDESKAPITKFTQRSRQSILNPVCHNSSRLPILQIGGHYKTKGPEGCEVTIQETCAVDCYIQVGLALYADSEKCRTLMDNSKDSFSSIIKLAMNTKTIKTVYIERGEFLRRVYDEYCKKHDNYFDTQILFESEESEREELEAKKIRNMHFRVENKSMVLLNCNIPINSMLKMISDNWIFYSVDKLKICVDCKIIIEKTKGLYVPVYLNRSGGILNLEGCLKDTDEYVIDSNCLQCGLLWKIIDRPKRVLFIDAEAFKDRLSINAPEVLFSEIPQQITYAGKRYNLKSVIDRENCSRGHYVVHIKRNPGTWESFDDITPLVIGKPPQVLHPNQLVYLMDELEDEDDSYERDFEDLSRKAVDSKSSTKFEEMSKSVVFVASTSTKSKTVPECTVKIRKNRTFRKCMNNLFTKTHILFL